MRPELPMIEIYRRSRPDEIHMSPRYGNMRAFFARIANFFNPQPRLEAPLNTDEFQRACKELVYWNAVDAGLSGPIEGFDGSLLHRAADGMYTIRMTLEDSRRERPAGDAANIILRSVQGLRVLLLLDIDGRRFTYCASNANAGVRELCASFTNRTESTG